MRLQSSDTTQRKCWPVVPVRGTNGREPLASQLIAHSVQLSTGRAQDQWRQSVALRDLTKPRIYGEQHWRAWDWERALGRRRGRCSTALCTCANAATVRGRSPGKDGTIPVVPTGLAMKSVFSPAGWEDLLIWKVCVESHLSLRCQPVHISPKESLSSLEKIK